jgi:hypothetical protein
MERARRGDVWRVAAAGLFACTCSAIAANNTMQWARDRHQWYGIVSAAVLFLTGLLTATGGRRLSPAGAAVKAALAGYLPEALALVFWTAGLFHPFVTEAPGPYRLLESRLAFFHMSFPTTPNPPLELVPVAIPVVIVQALVVGCAGGLLGHAVRACRRLGGAR